MSQYPASSRDFTWYDNMCNGSVLILLELQPHATGHIATFLGTETSCAASSMNPHERLHAMPRMTGAYISFLCYRAAF